MMDDVLKLIVALGPVGGTIAAVWFFLKHLAENRVHQSELARQCHESHERVATKIEAVTERSNTTMGEVGVHLAKCAENTLSLERTMSARAEKG